MTLLEISIWLMLVFDTSMIMTNGTKTTGKGIVLKNTFLKEGKNEILII